MNISAAEFKSKCLKIMDQVNDFHEEVIITKHGKPVAKLVPYSTKPQKNLFGFMKDSVMEKDDIIQFFDEVWDADKEDTR